MRYLFVLMSGLALVGMVLAQSGRVNQAIPACNAAQARQMIRLLDRSGAAEAYSALLSDAGQGDIPARIDVLLSDAIVLRRMVYAEVLPDVPDCAGAQRVASSFRRVVDDAVLALALAKVAVEDHRHSDAVDYSAELADGLADTGADAVNDVTELAALAGDAE